MNESRQSSSSPSSNDPPQPWDTLTIRTSAGRFQTIVLRAYPSGRVKVRHPSGHIIIVPPEDIIANHGYIPSEHDNLISLLVKYDRQSYGRLQRT